MLDEGEKSLFAHLLQVVVIAISLHISVYVVFSSIHIDSYRV